MPNLRVTIIIPCRNEAKRIGHCLDSVQANDYPKDCLEVLIVDGMSGDGTRAIAEAFATCHSYVRLLDNPRRIAPAALNIGIANARGTVIMRMDAHTEYPSHYVASLVGWLEKSGADNVGGVCVTRPASDANMAQAIAVGLSHPLGVGNSYFRIGTSVPRQVDTVPFGCYRREVFDRIGLFDEELVRNQDIEFNLRLRKRGGSILLVPDVVSCYYARDSLLKLWRMYYQYGYFNPLVVRKLGGRPTFRQLVPPLFVLSLLVAGALAPWVPGTLALLVSIAGAYVVAVVTCCLRVALQRGLRCGLALALVFPVLHVSSGLGALKGIIDFLILRKRIGKTDAETLPLTR